MGWTTMQFHGTRAQFVERELNRDPAWGRVLNFAVVGTVIYIAFELGEKHGEGKGNVIALIYLTKKYRDHYNFGYKDMEETCGPNETKCPKRILDLLTPLDELYKEESCGKKWAGEWREACRKYLEAAKTPKPKITEGVTVKMNEPLKFKNGWQEQYFVNKKGNLWESRNYGFLTRFRVHRFKFEIATA